MKKNKICVIGQGYVGLPLACEFSKKYETIGFDLNYKRIDELKKGIDLSMELSKKQILSKKRLQFTSNIKECANCNIFIISVPTPINKNKKPNLNFIKKASRDVGKVLKKGDIVIYESTVYPGVTEQICVPILEAKSLLKFNHDFFCGYSPERVNPGDKKHTISKIKKITSGSTLKASKTIDKLYKSIITAGTYRASSIKVAEAAKVIENIQRDLNISFVNELSIIFDKLSLDTNEVIEAASTKWNFIKFKPGLVGGHCIGVDPYYLTHISEKVGYKPRVILAGREVNENMPSQVWARIRKLMISKKIDISKAKVLILGYTFKENCPDIRNTKVRNLVYKILNTCNQVDIFDPWLSKVNVPKKLKNANFMLRTNLLRKKNYDCIILAVSHKFFYNMGANKIKSLLKNKGIIFDVKNFLDPEIVDGRL